MQVELTWRLIYDL